MASARTRRSRWPAIVALGIVPLVGGVTSTAQSRPVPTVLTVYWSSEDYPSNPVIDAGIRQALLAAPAQAVDYFAEFLESDLFPAEDASVALRDYIKRKFNGRHIDVVLAVADPALDFVLRYRAELFPDAPVVASVTRMPAPEIRAAGAGITGITGAAAYDKTLDLALRLHPATKRVFVVARAPTVNHADTVRKALQGFAERVELTYFDDPSVERLLAAVKSLPPDSLVLFVRHSQEEPGDVLYPADIARHVAQISPVPVYGQNESYLGSGLVGGVVGSRELGAKRAGEMTRQLLAGAHAQDLPIETIPLTTELDWRQITRWHVAPALIPRGADLRFRELTPWEQYRLYILGAAALMLLQGTLIGALLIQGRRRRRAEIALEGARAELSRVSRIAALGEFAAAIAHEVRQPLQAIVMNARGCLHRLAVAEPDLDEVRAGLVDVVDDGQRAGEVIRRNRELFRNHAVQAVPLDINTVVEEAIALTQTRLTEHHVTVNTALSADLPAVSGDRVEIQQVLLNLIANAIDAMEMVEVRSRRIDVATSRTEDGVQVTVTDTGIGLGDVDLQQMFSLSYTTKTYGTGVGLSISRSIIEAHRGRLWAEPRGRGGATFCFTLPRVRAAAHPELSRAHTAAVN